MTKSKSSTFHSLGEHHCSKNVNVLYKKPPQNIPPTVSTTNLLSLQQLTDFVCFLGACDHSMGRNFGQVAGLVIHGVCPSPISAQQLKVINCQTFGPVIFIFAYEENWFGDSEILYSRGIITLATPKQSICPCTCVHWHLDTSNVQKKPYGVCS